MKGQRGQSPRSQLEKAADKTRDGSFDAQDSGPQAYRYKSDFPERLHFTLNESSFRANGKNDRLRDLTRRFNLSPGLCQ